MGIFVEDTDAKARDFLRGYPVSFPTGYDWSLAIARPLGFRAMPYTVVLSPQGEVARRFVGPMTETDLVGAVEGLLLPR